MSVSKMIMGQAANQYVAPTYVENVFSTYLYEGTGSAKTITNGIDLSGEGGMVWIKRRDGNDHALQDTERGATKFVRSNTTGAEATDTTGLTSFNSNGFTLGISSGDLHNKNNVDHVSWTFRKQPKFFDVVTYSGNGATRTISHNLGSDVGMLIVKRTDASAPWAVWHRQLNGGTNSGQYYIWLNSTNAEAASSPYWNNTAPTSTEFTVSSDGHVNNASGTYVAYLFAHNDGDGDFGLTNDQDIIKCGSYTESTGANSVDLGFEPQFVLLKNTSAAENWWMIDTMRGMTADGSDALLRADTSDAEITAAGNWELTSTGFANYASSGSGHTYIYMAIRRGPMATPTSATDVFAIDTQVNQDPPLFDSGFPVDFALTRNVSSTANWAVGSRLIQGKQLQTNLTNAESSNPVFEFDFMDGWNSETLSTNSNVYSWMWKRAPSYFDAVAYTGTGSGNLQISHNLGAVPEMMWVKIRSGASNDWVVYHKDLPTSGDSKKTLFLNLSSAGGYGNYFADGSGVHVAPTSSVFTLGSEAAVNGSTSYNYIAYLFATVAGVSKVGSYTGTGSTGLNIDCGFSSGARFVMIKRIDAAPYDWLVWDSVRGIVSGDDKRLALNLTNAEVTQDNIDPLSSGFTISTTINGVNQSGGSYIFYAIAA